MAAAHAHAVAASPAAASAASSDHTPATAPASAPGPHDPALGHRDSRLVGPFGHDFDGSAFEVAAV